MDLTDHQKKFPDEVCKQSNDNLLLTLQSLTIRWVQWSDARIVSMQRRKKREEFQRQKDEEIARLHQEAIAESAMHAMNLEADINSNSASELHSLSKEFKDRPQEKDTKIDNENELVWNPCVLLYMNWNKRCEQLTHWVSLCC
ncbi:unnamed protein product [Phytophthora fragariaefolia]|uniref:Unnamed protein product n=1 Tax=Phytophthora fragariaefolia TaxID=1490495 RepID=A0A9W7D1B2_9STRA|nr:unnamed protein product [Phytophthora fragariaefolia]